MTTTTFLVPDMTCGHCEKTIRGALASALPGISVNIDIALHHVSVKGDAKTAETAIRDAGYTPERKS